MSLLEFDDVAFVHEGQTILSHLSLRIVSGDFISVVGPSGSGKSTFLKLCSHLLSPTKGNILFQGKDVTEYSPTELRQSISYCFQTPYLFGDTVMDNLNFPFTIRNEKPDEKRVDQLFSLFHMTKDYCRKDVKTLSGGEKQRIALMRNLLFPPQILLLDEVTSALDADNTAIVEDVIASLNNDGMTVLWVTHSMEQSRRHANKVLTIEAGEIKSLEVLHE